MILLLAHNHKKFVAGFMLVVFSSQLIVPALAQAKDSSYSTFPLDLRAAVKLEDKKFNPFFFLNQYKKENLVP